MHRCMLPLSRRMATGALAQVRVPVSAFGLRPHLEIFHRASAFHSCALLRNAKSTQKSLNNPVPVTPKKGPTQPTGEHKFDWRILIKLMSHTWPKGDNKTKIRVILALSLLFAGKLLNIQVPFFFKAVIDRLNDAFQHRSTLPIQTRGGLLLVHQSLVMVLPALVLLFSLSCAMRCSRVSHSCLLYTSPSPRDS